ncbi:MAG: alpha/beta fold hydrolase, partial [Actinomycetes bacterium]
VLKALSGFVVLTVVCGGAVAPAVAVVPTPQVSAPVAAAQLSGVLAAITEPPSARAAVRGDVARLRWWACPDAIAPTMQCATFLVPVDYRKPGGRQFTLALARVPATGEKKGSLFFNPGGPGGPGTATISTLATRLPASVRSRFDIVTWDPRGVGATLPALNSCPRPNLVLPATGVVDWPAVRSQAAASVKAANEQCQRNNAKYLGHVGTNNVVRDLDALRAAVGDKKLTYWGISYGTRIGYVYAMMFPDRIRALVLDGNISPKSTFADFSRVGSLAPDSALAFMKTASPPTYNSIIATLNGLDIAPINLGDGIQYTRWSYLTSIEGQIRYEGSWPGLIAANARIETARLATPAGAAERDRLREVANQSDGNLGQAFSVVNCLDYPQRMTTAAQDAIITHNAAIAPIYGGRMTTEYSLGCSGLSLRPDPVPTTRSATSRARIRNARVIIANATHDGATPMVWAKAMRASFASGVLIKYRGAQHGLWTQTPSTCVNNRITNYVVRLKMPRPVTCPFAPAPGTPRIDKGLDDPQSVSLRSPFDAAFAR